MNLRARSQGVDISYEWSFHTTLSLYFSRYISCPVCPRKVCTSDNTNDNSNNEDRNNNHTKGTNGWMTIYLMMKRKKFYHELTESVYLHSIGLCYLMVLHPLFITHLPSPTTPSSPPGESLRDPPTQTDSLSNVLTRSDSNPLDGELCATVQKYSLHPH